MKSSDSHVLYVNDDTIGFLVSGAAFSAIIALVPYINIINYVGLGVFSGGFLSVLLAGRSLSLQPNKSSSFKFGALAGIVGGIASVLIGNLIYLFADYDVNHARFALLLQFFSNSESTPSIAGFKIVDESGKNVQMGSVSQISFTVDIWTVLQQILIVFLLNWLPGGMGGLTGTLACKLFFSAR